MLYVRVAPAADGWEVSCDAIDNSMMFRSGAKAEDAARRLAQALADAGEFVEIDVVLRDGRRGARFVCAPTEIAKARAISAAALPLEAAAR